LTPVQFLCYHKPLHLLQHLFLELALHLLALVVSGRLAVEREQGAKVEAWLPEKLDFANVDLFV
jgi:hypothetical protein